MRNYLYKSILHTGKKVKGFAAEEIYLKQATANESKNKATFPWKSQVSVRFPFLAYARRNCNSSDIHL